MTRRIKNDTQYMQIPETFDRRDFNALSTEWRHLPSLSLSLSSETAFNPAYHNFAEWCSGEVVSAAWEHQNISVLQRNATYQAISSITFMPDDMGALY